MKYKDLLLYAVSYLALTLCVLAPLAAEPADLGEFTVTEVYDEMTAQAGQLIGLPF